VDVLSPRARVWRGARGQNAQSFCERTAIAGQPVVQLTRTRRSSFIVQASSPTARCVPSAGRMVGRSWPRTKCWCATRWRYIPGIVAHHARRIFKEADRGVVKLDTMTIDVGATSAGKRLRISHPHRRTRGAECALTYDEAPDYDRQGVRLPLGASPSPRRFRRLRARTGRERVGRDGPARRKSATRGRGSHGAKM
jgi:hypothetical protein